MISHIALEDELSERPSWDQIWMDFARSIAKRSVDPRFRVGAVVVNDDNSQVLAIGYNGDHRGGPNEVESQEPGHSGLLHAEINALIKCDFNSPKKKKMYLTLSPCRMCAKAIVNGGIQEVVYLDEYRDKSGIELLKSAGILVRNIPYLSEKRFE